MKFQSIAIALACAAALASLVGWALLHSDFAAEREEQDDSSAGMTNSADSGVGDDPGAPQVASESSSATAAERITNPGMHSTDTTRSAAAMTARAGELVLALENAHREAVVDAAIALRRTQPTADTVVIEVRSDADGRAIVSDLATGQYNIVVEATGFPRLRSKAPVHIRHDTPTYARCVIASGDASLSGRVLDAKGAALPGMTVLWHPLSPAPAETVHLVRQETQAIISTDSEGSFSITGVTAGEYSVETGAREGFGTTRKHVAAPADDVLLVVHAEFATMITGVVTERDGDVVPAATVRSATGEVATTDEDGRYELAVRITETPGSSVVVSAAKPGFSERYKTVTMRDARATNPLEMSFQLSRLRNLGALEGQLVGSHGSAAAGEAVYLQSASVRQLHTATADRIGRFRFDAVPAGDDYRLWVYPISGYSDVTVEPVEISSGVNELEVTLAPLLTGTLNATLMDAAGDPLPNFTVRVRSKQARAAVVSVTSDAEGRFRALDVPVGDLTVETMSMPKVTVRGLRLEVGQELSSEIPIGVGPRSLTGQVVLAGGSHIAGARVVVTWSHRTQHLHSSLFQDLVTDATGRFRASGLGAGRCAVSVSAVGVQSARRTVEIAPDHDPESLRIEMR